jgi:deoxyribonuclease V
MKIKPLHTWPRTPKAAIELQQRLAARVRLCPVAANVRIVAGADVAFSPDGSQVIAGVVVWHLTACTVVEEKLARVACRFPYIPGLLSFRELPAVLAAFRRLRTEPQVVLCDGQGLAHPRRVGLACHLGLWLERPTVGCAKSRLCGTYTEPPVEKGRFSPLLLDGEQVGVVLRTRTAVRPLFVSPGHLCDHDSAARLTLAATTRFRLPEPTRLAHQLVTRARNASG